MAHCDKDHTVDAVKTAIVDGKFGSYCMPHIKGTARSARSNAAVQARDDDYNDHRRDVIQPTAGGKINPEFVKEYPEESAELFTKDQMQQALRET